MSAPGPVRPMLAVGAVIFDGDAVVLVQRAKAPLAGHWTLPGGSVEVGETLAQAVVREVAEETGLIVTAGDLVEVYEHVSTADDGGILFHYVILDYLCHATGGQLSAGSDALAAAFVPVSEFDRYAVNEATRRVIGLGRRKAGEREPGARRLNPVVHR